MARLPPSAHLEKLQMQHAEVNHRPEHNGEQHSVDHRVHEPIVEFDKAAGCVENKDDNGSNQNRILSPTLKIPCGSDGA